MLVEKNRELAEKARQDRKRVLRIPEFRGGIQVRSGIRQRGRAAAQQLAGEQRNEQVLRAEPTVSIP